MLSKMSSETLVLSPAVGLPDVDGGLATAPGFDVAADVDLFSPDAVEE